MGGGQGGRSGVTLFLGRTGAELVPLFHVAEDVKVLVSKLLWGYQLAPAKGALAGGLPASPIGHLSHQQTRRLAPSPTHFRAVSCRSREGNIRTQRESCPLAFDVSPSPLPDHPVPETGFIVSPATPPPSFGILVRDLRAPHSQERGNTPRVGG